MWKKGFKLLLLVLLITGCSETIENQEGNGIQVSFIDGMQEEVFENEEYSVVAEIKNKGNYDNPYGKVVLGGFDRSVLPFSSIERGKAVKDLPAIEGVDEYNQEGGFDSVEYDIPKNHINLPYEGPYTPKLSLDVCYYYETSLAPKVCIIPDPSKADDAVCTPETKRPESQKAPVEVTKVEENIKHDFVNFAVTVENTGEGNVIAPDKESYKNCPGELKHQNRNMVEVDMEINDFPDPECSNDGLVKLDNGRGTALCEFQIRTDSYDTFTQEADKQPYTKQLKITLKYHYKSGAEKKITVKQKTGTENQGDEGKAPDWVEDDGESLCDCEPAPEEGYKEQPHRPCVCLYHERDEHFCNPTKDEPLEVDEENPEFTIYTSDPSKVVECGISGGHVGDCGDSHTYELGLNEDQDQREISVVGQDKQGKIKASQICKIKLKDSE